VSRPYWVLVVLAAALSPAAGSAQEPTSRMGGGAELDTDENAQPAKLPPLPKGMTVKMLQQGDALFRGKGGCTTCHGQEATGMPNMGSSLTGGLHFIPLEWGPIDSLILAGIPEPITRTAIAMPPRGAGSNLTPEESRLIAAYVWAISQTRGEPWPGGHRRHGEASGGGDSGGTR
jgi:mono/diheme cytochrome c family protein